MPSYPTSVNPFGSIAAAGSSRSSLYSERTAVFNLLAELTAVETDLVSARGASGSIASRLSVIDIAITTAQATAISTASTDATNKANSAVATASTDATNKANAAQTAAATDATTKANNALAAALVASFGRNRITNGNHSVSQRIPVGPFTTANAYTVDMHRHLSTGTTFSATRQTFAPGTIIGVAEGGFYYRTVVTSVAGASNYNLVLLPIEGVHTLAGQAATISFYAKADAARPIAVELVQGFGTGGSSDVNTFVAKQTLTTGWVRYSFTYTVPSINLKTIGNNSNDNLSLFIWFDSGSNYNSRTSSLGQQSGTFEIALVQLEAGLVATSFEYENPQVTLSKCERYFQKSYPALVSPGAALSNGYEFVSGYNAVLNSTLISQIRFRTTMRVTPTSVQGYSFTSGTANAISNAFGTDLAAFTLSTNTGSDKGFNFTNTSGASIAAPSGGGFIFHWAASAEI